MSAGSVMLSEMAEQPTVLRRLLDGAPDWSAALEPLRAAPPLGVVLVARGSSDNAALYARYVLEASLRRPVVLAAPSQFTRYGVGTRYAGWLAIGVSQSGRTPEIVDVVDQLGAAGATTLAVTNDQDEPLARAADIVLGLAAGAERAVPSTKTFLASLAAFAVLAQELGPVGWTAAELDALPVAVQHLLDDPRPAAAAAARLMDHTLVLHLGRGPLYSIAREGALKMMETAGVPAQGFAALDFLHGPLAVAGPGVAAVCYATPGPVLTDLHDVRERLSQCGATVLQVGAGWPVGEATLLAPAVPEELAPLLHVVRAQQLARELALLRGRDPDAPAALAKVTSTS